MTAQLRILLSVVLISASAALLWLFFIKGTGQGPDIQDAQLTPGEPYRQRDWSLELSSNINISVFTYRDLNLSGSYDQGDLPMAGVYVELSGPDGSRQRVASNKNGYVNFKMAKDNPKWPINQAGASYTFKTLVPPGWQVTSTTEEQRIAFPELPGSIAGLVADPPPDAVGLAPFLAIRGRVVASERIPEDLLVRAFAPSGEIFRIDVDAQGYFSREVVPGSWRIELESESASWHLQREIQVKHSPVELGSIQVGKKLIPPLGKEVVERFDWLSRAEIDKLPNGHLGLNWFYLLATHNQLYGGPGYVNGLSSGQAVGYNSSGHPVTISAPAGERFDFVGGYFSIAWPRAEGEILDIKGERGGAVVGQHSVALSHLGPIWLDAEFRDIDTLTLATRHYWQFVTDDLVFRRQNPAGLR